MKAEIMHFNLFDHKSKIVEYRANQNFFIFMSLSQTLW
uniref:Uncharacterized protein n=1 Tax=Anguilla anguilla TaxID=7936 RepID=A0A0E9QUF1_ANGAN